MSNRVYEAFLKSGLPLRSDGESYSATAYNVYRTICYRYNEKTFSSYPGLNGFILATGVTRQSVDRALTELKTGEIILQTKNGHRNQRAEFRPIYHLARLSDSDTPALHITDTKGASYAIESDTPDTGKGNATDPIVTGVLVPISTISNISTVSNYSETRYLKLLHLLPISLHKLQQGKNITESLDRLDAKGIPLEVTARHLSDHNYAGSRNPISVLIDRLEAFSYAQPDLIAERNRTLEHNRRLDEQNAEIERAKVSPEVADQYLSDIRRVLNQSKN